jgi:hypothetical protein
MTSSIAKVTSADARYVPSAEAADVTSAEAAHMASAKAAHVASATATASVSSAAAAGLRISGKKAAGKHCTCQNHHHSSSHDILLWNGRDVPPQALSDAGAPEEDKRQRRDGLEMGILTCRLY